MAGRSADTGVGLQDDQDYIGGPAYKAQHHTAAQEEPVVGVVVHQALQSMGDQRPAQGDLTPQGGMKEEDVKLKVKTELGGFGIGRTFSVIQFKH